MPISTASQYGSRSRITIPAGSSNIIPSHSCVTASATIPFATVCSMARTSDTHLPDHPVSEAFDELIACHTLGGRHESF
ncbi:MAG: hypothetical protein J07HQW2_03431 [Haloquadratum walsbyi J07HQW2]|uniref:Uncharacterized protein n=1 Tax=Haloquadratum walsbyi J07HQW2 TaxID=1238425 RepID=U1PT39_9EURY|nr:MAG: hypothetical protein J07HQW2_03431 [Haloquadratum walsbyi J07HQW2]